MKRIFSLLFVAVACSAAAFAQTSLVATLKHGSAISEYYGVSALKEAYADAANGDVITLSGGEFEAVDIEKTIIVRGAGMRLANENPTILLGDFTIKIPKENTSTKLTLEGMQCMNNVNVYGTNTTEQANIMKCYFLGEVHCAISNPTFMHCVFASNLCSERSYDGYSDHNTYVKCLECAVRHAVSQNLYGNYLAKFDMVNCVVDAPNGISLSYSTFTNCIITQSYWYTFTADCQISNSLCFGDGFNNVAVETNTFLNGDYSVIFKTLVREDFNTKETFELTDEAKAKYLGNDGTQMGIYGGTNPFDPTPTNPQIKKFNVSTSTSGDKLNLKINVE